jgi:hypothetical protein
MFSLFVFNPKIFVTTQKLDLSQLRNASKIVDIDLLWDASHPNQSLLVPHVHKLFRYLLGFFLIVKLLENRSTLRADQALVRHHDKSSHNFCHF